MLKQNTADIFPALVAAAQGNGTADTKLTNTAAQLVSILSDCSTHLKH